MTSLAPTAQQRASRKDVEPSPPRATAEASPCVWDYGCPGEARFSPTATCQALSGRLRVLPHPPRGASPRTCETRTHCAGNTDTHPAAPPFRRGSPATKGDVRLRLARWHPVPHKTSLLRLPGRSFPPARLHDCKKFVRESPEATPALCRDRFFFFFCAPGTRGKTSAQGITPPDYTPMTGVLRQVGKAPDHSIRDDSNRYGSAGL